LAVSDFGRSKSFFERALGPLGYKCLMEFPGAAGFGNDRPDFWIGHGKKLRPAHVAFAAADRAIVDAFYDAAIAAGGRDNGKGWYPDRGEQIPQVHIPDLRGQ